MRAMASTLRYKVRESNGLRVTFSWHATPRYRPLTVRSPTRGASGCIPRWRVVEFRAVHLPNDSHHGIDCRRPDGRHRASEQTTRDRVDARVRAGARAFLRDPRSHRRNEWDDVRLGQYEPLAASRDRESSS